MKYICDYCGKECNQVWEIPDEYMTYQASDLTGVYNPQYSYICYRCFCERFGIPFQEPKVEHIKQTQETIMNPVCLPKGAQFRIDLLKGNIAQAIVTSIFESFGYIVIPCGYENTFRGFIDDMKKADPDKFILKIRNSPDLIIYNKKRIPEEWLRLRRPHQILNRSIE